MKKIFIIAFTVLVAGCFEKTETKTADAASTTPPVGEVAAGESAVDGEIIATVNGVPISAARIAVYAPADAPNTEGVVENIITSELIAQEARKAGMDKQPDIVEQVHVAEQTVLGRAYTQQFISDNPVADEKISQLYEQLKAEYSDKFEYRSAHILVDDESLAQDLHAQISADGDKFAELAAQHSKDPGSAANGGDLGWADPRELVPEYANTMQATAPGQLAAPVQSQFGWHIIRVDEKRAINVPELNDEMRRRIQQREQAEQFTRHLEELRATATITRT